MKNGNNFSCFLALLLVGILAFTQKTYAQNITNYAFTATSGTYTPVSGTNPTFSGTLDEGYFNGIPIGFDFFYMGVRYTTVSASSNGWITLGSNISDPASNNNLSTGGTRPVIAPLWDDLALTTPLLSSIPSFSYALSGSAPNRILTLQWTDVRWNYQTLLGVTNIAFQVKLYETSGIIRFIYQPVALIGLNNPSASIGISAIGTGSGNFLSLNTNSPASTASPTVSSTTETTTNATKPASGQTYNFTPLIPTAPTSLTFSAVTSNMMTLNWVDNSNNEVGFAIYRSTDGVNYSYVNQTSANATLSTQIGLTPSTLYYWRVYAITEGGVSTPISGSQATKCPAPNISQIPGTNIIANYKFDGHSIDANGLNNGILQNSPTLTTDRFNVANNAYLFNGTTQYMATSNAYTNPTNITVSVWFKTTTTNGGKLIGFGNNQTGTSTQFDRHIYMNNAGQLYFGVNSGTIKTINSPLSYNDGKWHLATATLSATAGSILYVDGVAVANDATATTGGNYTGYWRVGAGNLTGWTSVPNSTFFNGILDDVLIYHRALSATEVGTIFKSPDGAGNNGPVCAGATLTLNATTVAGATYLWSGPNSFTSTLQNPTLSFSAAAIGVYTVQVTANSCTATAYTIVTSTGIGQWTGNISKDWINPLNWCSGTLPVAATNVVIPTGLTNYPALATQQAISSITIQTGASVTVQNGGNLQIASTITNNGTFNVSDGGITLNGSNAQNIAANVFDGNLIKNLTINNAAGVTLGGSLRLTGLLNVSNGAFSTAGFLTLASSASSTANVAAVPSGSSITGSVTVERFLSGGTINPYRTYRMLSSPVYDNTTAFINTNSQGNRTYKFSQFIDDMIVTGSGGATNGFDATNNNQPSAFTYNSNFISVTNINTTLDIGKGAYLFFRGNRSNFAGKTVQPFVDVENTIMTFKGILNQQNITVGLGYGIASNGGVGFNLVGNPYASTIDWDSANWLPADKVNINNSMWIWNPAIRGYATYKSGIGANGGSRYIASGQSFFVQATTTGGSITFKENIKINTQPPVILLSAPVVVETDNQINTAASALSLIRIKLKKPSAFNEDETVIALKENGNAAFDQEDAIHLDGEGVFLSSLSSDQIALAINFIPGIDDVNYVDLNVNATTTGAYTLDFSLIDFPAGYTLKLRDSLLNTITDLASGFVYNFNIDKNVPLSFGTKRFRLLIETPSPLPVSITSFTANKITEGVKLKWTTSEINNNYFQIHRATEANLATAISLSDILPNTKGVYEMIDRNPISGYNYYYLNQLDKNGKTKLYGPISVKYDLLATYDIINIFPNPVINSFTVKYNGLLFSDQQTISIKNATGAKVSEFKISKSDLINGYVINADKLLTGIYLVDIFETATSKRIGYVKMIKL